MKSKKDWIDWADKLNDEELLYLLDEESQKKPSNDIYQSIIRMIRNYKSIPEKKQIKEKTKSPFNIPSFKLAFSSLILITVIVISFFAIKLNFLPEKNICTVTSIKGNAYIIDKKNNKKVLYKNDKINTSSIIITDNGSNLKIKHGKKSYINVYENSKLIFNKLYKFRNIEKTEIYIEKGRSYFSINKFKNKSYFKVETDYLIASVVGTEFTISAEKEKSSSVKVKEGTVNVKAKIDINKEELMYIKKISPLLTEELREILDQKFTISTEQLITISYYKLKKAENEIKQIINDIKNELEVNKKSDKKIKEIINNAKNEVAHINNIIIEIPKEEEYNLNKDEIINFEEENGNDKNTEIKKEKNDKTKNKDDILNEIKINSPKSRYYDKTPTFDIKYNVNISKIYLNDEEISPNNNIIKIDSGLYQLKVISKDKNKNENIKTTTFFVNKLQTVLFTDFSKDILLGNYFTVDYPDRGDNDDNNFAINDWGLWTNNRKIIKFDKNRLIVTGSKNKLDYINLFKTFDAKNKDIIISKIDIIKIGNPTNNLITVDLGIQHNLGRGSIHAAIVKKYYNNKLQYKLFLAEWLYETDELIIFNESDPFDIKFNKPVSLIFCKKKNSYAAILVDNDENIINAIYTDNYIVKQDINKFNKIKLGIFPTDDTNDQNPKIIVDNYYLFTE